uniref:Transcription initiation factor TFIID subunit 3 n=1 Tax=Denticeps clupeoides TaxID=299321 RepID=A0AAY4E205_9TELE
MCESYARSVLRVALAQICQVLGWDAMQISACDLLSDVLDRYLQQLATQCHRNAELHGRTIPELTDVAQAFGWLGVSLPELEDYVGQLESTGFPQAVHLFPISKSSVLQFPPPGEERSECIHDYMPPLISPHEEEEEQVPVAIGTSAEAMQVSLEEEEEDDDYDKEAENNENHPANHGAEGLSPQGVLPAAKRPRLGLTPDYSPEWSCEPREPLSSLCNAQQLSPPSLPCSPEQPWKPKWAPTSPSQKTKSPRHVVAATASPVCTPKMLSKDKRKKKAPRSPKSPPLPPISDHRAVGNPVTPAITPAITLAQAYADNGDSYSPGTHSESENEELLAFTPSIGAKQPPVLSKNKKTGGAMLTSTPVLAAYALGRTVNPVAHQAGGPSTAGGAPDYLSRLSLSPSPFTTPLQKGVATATEAKEKKPKKEMKIKEKKRKEKDKGQEKVKRKEKKKEEKNREKESKLSRRDGDGKEKNKGDASPGTEDKREKDKRKDKKKDKEKKKKDKGKHSKSKEHGKVEKKKKKKKMPVEDVPAMLFGPSSGPYVPTLLLPLPPVTPSEIQTHSSPPKGKEKDKKKKDKKKKRERDGDQPIEVTEEGSMVREKTQTGKAKLKVKEAVASEKVGSDWLTVSLSPCASSSSLALYLYVRDEWGNRIWICPGCNKPDDGSPMIGCDQCDDWYHWPCVGLLAAPPEYQQWFCVKCAGKKTDKKQKKKRR